MTEPLHIVCPHCHTTNRVQSAQLGSAPDCGSCHKPLFAGAPLELDADSFAKHVQRSQIPMLVDFWGQSCEPCKALMPHIHAMEEKYGDKIKFASLDISKGRRVAMAQGVAGLPAIYIYKDGVMIEDLRGDAATATAVEELIQKHI